MESIAGLDIKTDCLFFKGDLPCAPHKKTGEHCASCAAYQKISKRILIIKLGAIGDVIRTTPLIRRIRKEFPNAKISWLTHTPAILPVQAIDEILKYDFTSVLYLQQVKFDIVYNLDKDKDACALVNTINATHRFGYCLKDGVPFPMNQLAEHKFSTGLFDDVSKANQKSYVQEIFELAGWNFEGEEYLFDNHQDKGFVWNLPAEKNLIGLNTGCGDRWTTRLWPETHWVKLIQLLQQEGFEPVLLGGEQEHEKNSKLANLTGAHYSGFHSLPKFINLMYQMDLIVTQVTMAMHIAVALQKQMVLMNNIFNPFEFELYQRGQIISPSKPCECYFQGTCKNGQSCMTELSAESVLHAIIANVK